MSQPLASVIMINRNGGDLLRTALRTCRRDLETTWVSDPRFEFLFVDNGSTDQSLVTAQQELQGAAFPWRIVQEPIPGVNSSRNAGLREAQGELLIYTDSDLEFAPGWLKGYLAAATEYPAQEVFAGRVAVGLVEGPVPAWLDLTGPFRRTAIVVQMDAGAELKTLPLDNADGLGPVGPNMAFRRSIFLRHGAFDTRFGLRPGSLVPGAEAEFFDRIARAGLAFIYVPQALVYHPLRKHQISKQYFLKRLHGIGRVQARIQRLRGTRCKRLFGMTLYVFEYLLAAYCTYLLSFLGSGQKKRFFCRSELARLTGYLHEDMASYFADGPPESELVKLERSSAIVPKDHHASTETAVAAYSTGT
jgi:glycosyltransferase involved in cell wall biosynthesis